MYKLCDPGTGIGGSRSDITTYSEEDVYKPRQGVDGVKGLEPQIWFWPPKSDGLQPKSACIMQLSRVAAHRFHVRLGGTGFLHFTPDGNYVTVASGKHLVVKVGQS